MQGAGKRQLSLWVLSFAFCCFLLLKAANATEKTFVFDSPSPGLTSFGSGQPIAAPSIRVHKDFNVWGKIASIAVHLNNFHHPHIERLAFMLTGPTNDYSILSSGCGEGCALKGNNKVTFTQRASLSVKDWSDLCSWDLAYYPIRTGICGEANSVPTFPPPYAQTIRHASLKNFIGKEPSGTWNLWIVDSSTDEEKSEGAILLDSWSVSLTFDVAESAKQESSTTGNKQRCRATGNKLGRATGSASTISPSSSVSPTTTGSASTSTPSPTTTSTTGSTSTSTTTKAPPSTTGTTGTTPPPSIPELGCLLGDTQGGSAGDSNVVDTCANDPFVRVADKTSSSSGITIKIDGFTQLDSSFQVVATNTPALDSYTSSSPSIGVTTYTTTLNGATVTFTWSFYATPTSLIFAGQSFTTLGQSTLLSMSIGSGWVWDAAAEYLQMSLSVAPVKGTFSAPVVDTPDNDSVVVATYTTPDVVATVQLIKAALVDTVINNNVDIIVDADGNIFARFPKFDTLQWDPDFGVLATPNDSGDGGDGSDTTWIIVVAVVIPIVFIVVVIVIIVLLIIAITQRKRIRNRFTTVSAPAEKGAASSDDDDF